MITLIRVKYFDQGNFLCHEWYGGTTQANDRVLELDNLGMEAIDYESIELPTDNWADMCRFLNNTPNSPYMKDGSRSKHPPPAVDRRASALDAQVGGDHYKKLAEYQPWEVLSRWMSPAEFRGYMKGQAMAYLAREQDKGGSQDMEKAMHTLQGFLEIEQRNKGEW